MGAEGSTGLGVGFCLRGLATDHVGAAEERKGSQLLPSDQPELPVKVQKTHLHLKFR